MTLCLCLAGFLGNHRTSHPASGCLPLSSAMPAAAPLAQSQMLYLHFSDQLFSGSFHQPSPGTKCPRASALRPQLQQTSALVLLCALHIGCIFHAWKCLSCFWSWIWLLNFLCIYHLKIIYVFRAEGDLQAWTLNAILPESLLCYLFFSYGTYLSTSY